jgi:hypothetical protein
LQVLPVFSSEAQLLTKSLTCKIAHIYNF